MKTFAVVTVSLLVASAAAVAWLLPRGAADPGLVPADPARVARPSGNDRTAGAAIPPAIARLLLDIRSRDTGQLAVSEEDGRFLRLLVATAGAKRALEIGGASGYSAIWMGLGLRETGGRLVTIEYDADRARELAANIDKAGLTDVVTVVAGDAFKEIPRLSGTFDFVFLDAWKRDYQRFFDLVFPRLQPGGLFVGHNVINKRDELEDFLATVERHPLLFTSIVSPSGEGMSVSYRRR
jgi:predicted O-methyltransferase YrrM